MGGLHLILDAQATRFLSDRAQVEAWVREAAALGNMTILGIMGYDLKIAWEQQPGVSVIALLAESHISVHTWPETGYITMDMYSCRPFDVGLILGSFGKTFGVTEKMRWNCQERYGFDSALVVY